MSEQGSARRKVLAADPRLAEALKRVASGRGQSLYALLNSILESYLELDRAGYHDPREAVVDLVVLRSLLSIGFTLSPPRLEGEDAWRALGLALWSVVRSRLSERDPGQLLARVASLMFGERNVSVVTGEQLTLLVTLPHHPELQAEGLRTVLEAVARGAFPQRTIEARLVSNIVVVSVR